MKKRNIILLSLLAVLLLMQLYRPDRNEMAETPDSDLLVSVQPPGEVKVILEQACYDCHSNNTHYPWYAGVAPVSYWIADHVNEGKEHLNFSEWELYDVKRKAHKMEEIAEEVAEGEMPLKSYTVMHGNVKLTAEEIEVLTQWASAMQLRYEGAPAPQ